jgi:hypothetical protein
MNTNMLTPIGTPISTRTNTLIKTRNTTTSILTYMIMNMITSISTNTIIRVHQMFTIMSIKVNMEFMIIATLDIRQKTINISMRRLNRDLGGSTVQSIMEVINSDI